MSLIHLPSASLGVLNPAYRRAQRDLEDKAQTESPPKKHCPGNGASDSLDTSVDEQRECAIRAERLAIAAPYFGADSGFKKPAHVASSKKRNAPCQLSGEYPGDLPLNKRENTGDHANKTVNLDAFWNAKKGSVGMHPHGEGKLIADTPDGASRVVEPCYEGRVSDIPPYPHEYIANFLTEFRPNCRKAQTWVKAHEASHDARLKAAQKNNEKAESEKTQSKTVQSKKGRPKKAQPKKTQSKKTQSEKAQLEKAQLEKAQLEKAQLEKAQLEKAQLEKALFEEAQPEEAGQDDESKATLHERLGLQKGEATPGESKEAVHAKLAQQKANARRGKAKERAAAAVAAASAPKDGSPTPKPARRHVEAVPAPAGSTMDLSAVRWALVQAKKSNAREDEDLDKVAQASQERHVQVKEEGDSEYVNMAEDAPQDKLTEVKKDGNGEDVDMAEDASQDKHTAAKKDYDNEDLEKAVKASQERLAQVKKDREYHERVIAGVDHAHKKLLKTMYGNNPPKPSNDDFPKYPAGGFPTAEQEKKFVGSVVGRVDDAQKRLIKTMGELRATMRANATDDDTPKASKSGASLPEPMGPRRTPEGTKDMERKRAIHPGSAVRVKKEHEKFQKAAFGDEDISDVKFNEKSF